MAQNYKAYSPDKVSCMFAGLHRVRGYGADAMIDIAFDSDFGEIAKSADNENRHVDLLDRSGTITVTLSDQSASNAFFTGIVAAGVPVPVTLVDKSSNGDLFVAGSVKIRTMPGMVKAKSNGEKVWVWQFTNGRMTHAGAVA
jgi:hypothetical protein